ncbi:LysM peptidoglycan-binding domain-containing protein [bacterium]|nr:LysM peptidoglycan-binding domain-containing protein [bacterium]
MKIMLFWIFPSLVAFAGKMNDDLYIKQWKLTHPIQEQEWNRLMGSKATETYIVKAGDTLSKISLKQFGTMEYWPKLWEVNKDSISNPHRLEPELKIVFVKIPVRNPQSESSEQTKKKVDLDRKQGPADLPDQLLKPDLAHQHRLRLVFLDGLEKLGVITGSFAEKNYMEPSGQVYIGIYDKTKIAPKTRLAVIRPVELPQSVQKKVPSDAGALVEVVGELEVEAYERDLVRAYVASAYAPFQRGDSVVKLGAFDLGGSLQVPPANLILEILMGENLDNIALTQGQTVVLNKGSQSGVQVGQHFQIYDDEDPIFKDSQLIEPRSKGEARIVYVTPHSSIGYLIKVKNTLEVGNVLVASGQLPQDLNSFQRNREPFPLE